MFYSINMLRKKDGLYAVVWLHATNQRVSKKMAQSANVPQLADALIQEEIPLALRTSACLLIGIVRIYETCVSVGWREATNVRFYTGSKRSSAASSAKNNIIDMPKRKIKRVSIDLGWDEDEFLQRLEAPFWDEHDSEDLANMYERINEKYIVTQRPEDTLMLETPSNLLDGTPGMDTDLNFGYSFSRSNLILDAGSTPGQTPNSRSQNDRTPRRQEDRDALNSSQPRLFDEEMDENFLMPASELSRQQQQLMSPSPQAELCVEAAGVSPFDISPNSKRASPEDNLHNLSFDSRMEPEPARKRSRKRVRKPKKINLRDPRTEIDVEEWQRMHSSKNDYLMDYRKDFQKPISMTEMVKKSCGCFDIGAKNFKLLTSSSMSKFASVSISEVNPHMPDDNVQATDALSDVERKRGPDDSMAAELDLYDDKLSVKSGKSEQSTRSARLSALPNAAEMMDADFDHFDLNMERGDSPRPMLGDLDSSFAEECDPKTRADMLLSAISEAEQENDDENIDFNQIVQGKTRAARAGAFYSLLVLATTKKVDVHQYRDGFGVAGKILMTLV